MQDLVQVFDFVAEMISDYLLALNSNWLSQIFLYLLILSIVVSTILLMRGK